MTRSIGQDGTVTCRGCGGTAPAPGDDGTYPLGWYALTVAIPPGLNRNGSSRRYVWVGLFCRAACLLAHGATLLDQERLARLDYEAVIADPPARPRRAPRQDRRRVS